MGFVASLSRPGGNVTGVVFTITDLAAKQLGLLIYGWADRKGNHWLCRRGDLVSQRRK
jgi:hypothetical protein